MKNRGKNKLIVTGGGEGMIFGVFFKNAVFGLVIGAMVFMMIAIVTKK